MGLIRKVASIMMLGGVSSHPRREPPGKAERARAKAERAQEKAAQAQAVRAEAEAKRLRPCRSGHQTPDSGMEGARPGTAPAAIAPAKAG